MQVLLHLQQALCVFFVQLGQGNTRHLGDCLGDHLRIDSAAALGGFFTPLLLELFLLLFELVGLVAQVGCAFKILLGDRLFFLPVEALDLLLGVTKLRPASHRLHPDPGTGLIDHVDGLVRQEPAGNIAGGELHGRFERLVLKHHAVMTFVLILKTLEDFNRLLLRRRMDDDVLEAPLQRSILLDELAVLIECRGSDALHLSTGKSRLENVGSVDGSLRSSGAYESMELINKENDVLDPANLGHHSLDPLFELAAVLGAGNHHRQVKRDDSPISQNLGNVAIDNVLREPLDDGCFANAGLTEKNRIVLSSSAQDLDHALNFIMTPDDRVQLAIPGQLGQVTAEGI